MTLYRILSVCFFILRYGLRPSARASEIGLSAIRQLYLIKGKPIFKSSEDALLWPFSLFLKSVKDDEGDVLFYINPDNRLPPDVNSKESVEVLKDYDLLPPV